MSIVVGGDDSKKLSYVQQLLSNCRADSLDVRVSLAERSQQQVRKC
jgi:hypothetical protein